LFSDSEERVKLKLIDDDFDNAAYLDEVDLSHRETRRRVAQMAGSAEIFEDPELLALTEEEDVY
jgi:hypothetical protein